MPKTTFPYTQIPLPPSDPYPNGHIACRPYVIANVTASNGESVRCVAWPDSGADCCVFPLSIAILLKLDVLNLPKAMTGGVGSSANVTYYAEVTISLDNGIEFKTFAGFTQGMDAQGIALLGQDGFFENYSVEFLHRQKIFTVEPK